MTFVCPGCQQPVPAGRTQCSTCGTLLPSASAASAAPADWWVGGSAKAAAPMAVPVRQATLPTPAAQPLSPEPVVAYEPVAGDAGKSMHLLLLIGFAGGGLLLFLGLGVVLAVLIFAGNKKKDLSAGASDSVIGTTQVKPLAGAKESPPADDDLPTVHVPRMERFPDATDRVHSPPASIDVPTEPEKPRLAPQEQERVNKAIDDGLAFLSKQDYRNRGAAPQVGQAAITGLTMLECGVSPDDPRVRNAADFVRKLAPSLNDVHTTYQISLSLLFLDRLGDPQDEKLIRSMGLRLVAGQRPEGGWNYNLPMIKEDVEPNFLAALNLNRPMPAGLPPARVPAERLPTGGPPPGEVPTDRTRPIGESPNTETPESPQITADPKALKQAVAKLPADLRTVPTLAPGEQKVAPPGADGDNSNTQFATLALWVAGRHGVPIERSMALLGQRFRTTQSKGQHGTWGYQANSPEGSSLAMTGAGLLGLAVAHGVGPDRAPGDGKPVKDEQIQRGLAAFGQSVGQPLGVARKKGRHVVFTPGVNLYYLWTLERVAVLYRLETLNGMDWYTWGAELLVDSQHPDGSWGPSGYPGANYPVDTCFALLFLKRANLARDLAQKLEFVVEAKDPGTSR